MSGQPETFEPVDLSGRDDVREALDLLLARVGALYLVVHRLESFLDREVTEAAWALAARVYGTHPEGGVGDADHERVDVVEARELAGLLERLAGAKPAA